MTELTSTLVPNLWRMACALAVSAVIVALLIRLLRLHSPQTQQLLWLLVLVQGIAFLRIPIELPQQAAATPDATPATLLVTSEELEPPTAVAVLPPSTEAPDTPATATTPVEIQSPNSTSTPRLKSASWSWRDKAAMAWSLGMGLVFVLGAFRYASFCRRVARGRHAPDAWQQECAASLQEVGIKTQIPLLLTESLGPALCRLPGRHVVVVPEAMWRNTDANQRRGILLHEVVHFRRRDLWTSLLAQLMTAVQWFNPFAWWSLVRFRTCQEWACDDAVAGYVGDADYARTLMDLGQPHRASVSLVHAVQTGAMYRRIERLITGRPRQESIVRKAAAVTVVGVLLLAGLTQLRFVPTSMSFADDSASPTADELPKHALLRLGDPRLRHREFVQIVKFSPDGRYIASACANSEPGVRLWDASTGRQVDDLEPPNVKWGWVESLAFSDDAQHLITGDVHGYVSVWNVAEHRLLSRLEKHKGDVEAVAFRPGTTEFATGGEDGWIRVYDLKAPANEVWFHVATAPAPADADVIEGSIGVAHLAYTTDGRQLIAGLGKDALMVILDADSGDVLSKTVTHGESLTSISVTPDSQRVMTGGFRRIPRNELPAGMDYYAGSVQIGEARVFDSRTGQRQADLLQDEVTVSFGYTALSPDGALIACGDFDRLQIRAADTGEPVRSIPIPGWWGRTPTFSPDGALVAAAVDNRVAVWNVESGERVLTDPGAHESYVNAVAYSSEWDLCVTSSADGSVHLWNATTGEQIWRRVIAPDSTVSAAHFSADGSRVIVGGEADDEIHKSHGVVVAWNIDGEELSRFELPRRAGALAVAPDGKQIAVTHSNGSLGDTRVALWQLDPPQEIATFPRDAETGLWDCEYLSFAADGQRLWAVEDNSHVTGWHLAEPADDVAFDADWRLSEEQRKENKYAWLGAAAFSTDTSTLVTSWDGSLFIWDLPSGQLRGTIHVPEVAKYFDAVAVAPDGKTVAAAEVIYAGEPGTDAIRVFDLESHALLRTLQPNDRACCLDFSPDSQRLLSGFVSGTSMIWDAGR